MGGEHRLSKCRRSASSNYPTQARESCRTRWVTTSSVQRRRRTVSQAFYRRCGTQSNCQKNGTLRPSSRSSRKVRGPCAKTPMVSVATKLLSGLILHRLVSHREKQMRENQAGFRPGRGCVDQIFTLRQVLEQRHSFQQLTMVVFLDFKSAFDSVDRQALWQCLTLKGVPSKILFLLKSLYTNSRGRVRVYGQLSPEFTTSSDVRQGCPFHLSYSNLLSIY